MIKSLSVTNYRLFKHFEIDSLSNVNLIVGTNNSGKSSLLEAINLLTSDDVRTSLLSLLRERGEYALGTVTPPYERSVRSGFQVAHIFYGHSQEFGQVIHIASRNERHAKLDIAILAEKEGEIPEQDSLSSNRNHVDVGEKYIVFDYSESDGESNRVAMRLEGDVLISDQFYTILTVGAASPGGSRLLTTNYLGYDELAVLWDQITLTPKEDRVIDALRILEPDVERISFTSRQTSNSGILLRLANQEEPVPLGSMGDGMRRILAIAASLVGVGQGTLLVDEIDTGLYYAVLKDMWKLIFETAYKQNTQVFATTHSWDCVKAFQQALAEFRDASFGRLIRLDRDGDQINAVSYLADELSVAIEQDIEVR